MVKQVKVKVKGTAPLLMNKFVGDTEETKKKSKKVYVPQEEAERKTYRTEEGKLFLPNKHFKASMIAVGSDFVMKGRKTYKEYLKSGIFIEPEEIVLDQQKYEIHTEPVVIQRARVLSWRPKFKEWSCSFTINIENDDWIDAKVLKEILEAAGKFKGVGDYRPEYGRFVITEWKVK